MRKYHFYYDETEHSRKINRRTVTAENYYDGFVTAVVGWEEQYEDEIEERYRRFEEKHSKRMIGDEIKSTTIKQSQLKKGFASLSRDTAAFIDDFLDVFDEKTLIYVSTFSKMEYMINQLFVKYRNFPGVNMNLLRYSITKAIIVYRPDEVISSLYGTPGKFLQSLKIFLRSRIVDDQSNAELKSTEIAQFKAILFLLDNVAEVRSFDWDYRNSLTGLQLFLQEEEVRDYSLVIDRDARTAASARALGLENVSEGESTEVFALRIADMLAGIVAKLMKALAKALRYESVTEETKKKLLDAQWFSLSEERLALYKKLHKVVMQVNNAWYKVYSGVYADDLVCFTTFLSFVNKFASADEMKQNLDMMPEYFNAAACSELVRHYSKFSGTAFDVSIGDDRESIYCDWGDVVECIDEDDLPLLRVSEGERTCRVLSVGVTGDRAFAVIIEEGKEKRYCLPDNLFGWAETLELLAVSGVDIFPESVTFTVVAGGLAADIH